MSTLGDRRVNLETCQNFRDLGGYATADGRSIRWGVLYRADTLHRLSGPDLTQLAALGLRTVIDLRARFEVEEYGRVVVEGSPITYHHLPMLDEVMGPSRVRPDGPRPSAGQFYVQMKQDGGGAIARAVTLLAEPGNLPAVFHCTAGKDRTGILAGVVLSALGVADDDVVADYVLTAECRAERDAFLAVHDPEYLAFLDTLPPGTRDVLPESMQYFLDAVRAQHGSMRGFLGDVGVAGDVLARLEGALLEA